LLLRLLPLVCLLLLFCQLTGLQQHPQLGLLLPLLLRRQPVLELLRPVLQYVQRHTQVLCNEVQRGAR
jgi:hypothetical protein